VPVGIRLSRSSKPLMILKARRSDGVAWMMLRTRHGTRSGPPPGASTAAGVLTGPDADGHMAKIGDEGPTAIKWLALPSSGPARLVLGSFPRFGTDYVELF
jgi:hypothetical protein